VCVAHQELARPQRTTFIAELHRNVQERISRLPVAFYDSNETGNLVSRIMNDAEGVRNLLGTSLSTSGAAPRAAGNKRKVQGAESWKSSCCWMHSIGL
jgi:ABC-type multidrug transport system fused ATPase/permease subunit